MIVAAHQPDLLPYSGFWHKMAKADVFEVNPHYQFVDKGYQRRVKMRNKWMTVPVIGSVSRSPIKDVRIDPDVAREQLLNVIKGRYTGARYFKERGEQVVDLVAGLGTHWLWELNLELMLGVRDMLGITTPIAIGSPLRGTKSDAIVTALQEYGACDTHLSGPGAREYMGDGIEFKEAGIDLVFSRHKAVTGDSIISVIMDYRNPLDIVLAEEAL